MDEVEPVTVTTLNPTILEDYIAYTSPLLYMLFVELCKLLLPRETPENKETIAFWRKMHNLGLSLASLAMFLSVCYKGFEGKSSLHGALCHRFRDEAFAGLVGWSFYASKYWEWLDTAFLIIADKEITWLQYTHHMSTAILVYANITPIVSSASLLASFTNTFVHIPMYLYFAYPHGVMKNFRQGITIIQLIQHVACVSGWTYIYLNIDNCYSTKIGIEMALGLYTMYLTFFSVFYFVQYIKSPRKDTQLKQKKVK